MNEFEQLALRCEQASVEEQADLLEEAFRLCDPPPKRMYANERRRQVTQPWAEWSDREERFMEMMYWQAYESAAMTLVPDGWEFIRLERQRALPDVPDGWLFECVLMEPHGKGYSKTYAQTKALAICAAALRARA
jgi:hypothetical protein